MASQSFSACAIAFLLFCAPASAVCGQSASPNEKKQSTAAKTSTKQASPEEQLQQAINNSGNDRAALVRNLEAFLKEYPDSRQRPQIYRALVEASLQLRDNTRAAAYAERIVALSPDDISMAILPIQLLEPTGAEAALRRATNYATRVLEFVEHSSAGDKSPKISQEEWAAERKRDRMSVLAMRGRLELKLKDTLAAQKDFEASYAILPGAAAAEQLGEIAEMKKDSNGAIQQYARAFALADATNGTAGRREIRKKLGNVSRLAHGSDDGLGEYLLRTYDDVSQASIAAKPKKNADAREPADFTLRKAPEGTAFSLAWPRWRPARRHRKCEANTRPAHHRSRGRAARHFPISSGSHGGRRFRLSRRPGRRRGRIAGSRRSNLSSFRRFHRAAPRPQLRGGSRNWPRNPSEPQACPSISVRAFRASPARTCDRVSFPRPTLPGKSLAICPRQSCARQIPAPGWHSLWPGGERLRPRSVRSAEFS